MYSINKYITFSTIFIFYDILYVFSLYLVFYFAFQFARSGKNFYIIYGLQPLSIPLIKNPRRDTGIRNKTILQSLIHVLTSCMLLIF